ncbi:uncharacterized protein THITE_2050501, partial [Thermothielavioides terrestris NRRL 8126]
DLDQEEVLAELGFLSRLDHYFEVKPYGLRFQPPGNLAQSNIEGHMQLIRVRNARLRGTNVGFDQCGFFLAPFSTSMDYADFQDFLKVKDVYCAEVEEAVKAGIPAARHTRGTYQIRRRDINFPTSTGVDFEHAQPANMAHTDFPLADFTPDIAISMIRTLYGPRADEVISQGWAIVNAWRPLKHPVQDWPLAVCDSRTFDAEHDGVATDVVYPDWISEDVLVHYNENQEWWFFPEQRPDEILIFKSVDSEKGLNAACPHAAFANPEAPRSAPLRESIDCRIIVFFTDAPALPPEVGKLYGAKK